MSFHQKIVIVFFILLIGAPIGVWFYYKKSRPVHVPITPREEISVMIIPGWNLRDVADYFVKLGIASSTEQVYQITGYPAILSAGMHRKYQYPPDWDEYDNVAVLPYETDIGVRLRYTSYEGYLAPETYRVYKDASLLQVLQKIADQRTSELTTNFFGEISSEKYFKIFPNEKSGNGYDLNQVITMGSILEKEAKTELDRKMVADILWRRVKKGMPLQVDSSVHYTVDKTGDIFTTGKERSVDSPYNTYKYAGLPPGPICNPSVEAIEDALNPESNDSWYFLSGNDGQMHYAKTLAEQQRNIERYLR